MTTLGIFQPLPEPDPVAGPLTPEDLAELEAHAVSPELAMQLGAASDELGISIPTPTVTGHVVPVTRIRPRQRENPAPGERVRKITMPKGATPGLTQLTAGDGTRAVIVEGFLQSLAVATWAPPGLAVFMMHGANGIHDRTDLSRFRGHTVTVMFDADAEQNEAVREASFQAVERLRAAGAKASAVRTPGVATDGADDVLSRLLPAERTAEIERWLWDGNRLKDRFEKAVSETELRLEAAEEAKRRVRVKQLGDQPPFDAGTLAEILARPPEPPYRIEGLMPSDSSTMVIAQRKVGKTTFVLNLCHALISGGLFLDRFVTRPIEPQNKVCILNYEVGASQVARWADRAHVDPDRLYVVNLRGRRNPLSSPEDRAELAGLLRAQRVESVIVDVFGRAFTGENQNDNGEVGAFLVDLDRFAREEVGARDLVLTAHAGWQNERSRGASALEDWPDSIITLVKNETDGFRYFRAIGRDVEIEEDKLELSGGKLRMTGAGNRAQAIRSDKLNRLLPKAIEAVAEMGPLTGTALETHWRENGIPHQKGDGFDVLKTGPFERIESRGNAKPYRLQEGYHPNHPSTTPVLPRGAVESTTPTTPIGVGGVLLGDLGQEYHPTPESSTAEALENLGRQVGGFGQNGLVS